jgi:hypothetical protein
MSDAPAKPISDTTGKDKETRENTRLPRYFIFRVSALSGLDAHTKCGIKSRAVLRDQQRNFERI